MRMPAVWVFLVALALAEDVDASERIRYVILVDDGKAAGEQVVEHRDDGQTRVHYTFKNNVERPELDEEYRLAPDGTYAEYRVKGTSIYGAPVDEEFIRNGDRAVWKSTSERGERTVSGAALYVPVNGTLQAASIAIAAIAARPDGKLPLLPAGILMQRKLDEVAVIRAGQGHRVQLLAQTGQGLRPSFYWATTGPKPRLFAFIAPGYLAAIEEGAEGSVKTLTAHQQQAEEVLLRDMAARLMKPMSGLTAIRNARVFDSENARLNPPSDVYVLRGRITAVLPAGTSMGKVDHEIDGGGRVLLPGLFDMHAHTRRWSGGLNLAAGITTVRDPGNDNATMQQMLDELEAGKLLGPQIVPAGLLEGESEFAWRRGFVINALPQAKEAVDWYGKHGYRQLKIYNSFPKEILRDTVEYAHSRGMRVSGHVPAFMRAQDVVDAGFDEIHHIIHVLLNFLVTPTTDTRTVERFSLPAEKVADLDFDAQPVQEFIRLLARKQIVVDPTLATFDFLRQRDGDLSQAYAAIFDHVPLDLQRGFHVGIMKIPDEVTARRYERSYSRMIDFVGRMFRAGIPLVAGSDDLAGFTLHREFELYVQAGLTPTEVLQIATWNGAKYTGTLGDRGSITPGKRADLTLIDGDPTTNISDVRRVALVITQGRLFSPREIHEVLGIKPFVQDVPEMRRITGTKAIGPGEAGAEVAR